MEEGVAGKSLKYKVQLSIYKDRNISSSISPGNVELIYNKSILQMLSVVKIRCIGMLSPTQFFYIVSDSCRCNKKQQVL